MRLTRDQREYIETLGFAPTAWLRWDEEVKAAVAPTAPPVAETPLATPALWVIASSLKNSDPYSGSAGQLLAKMCDAIGLRREQILVTSYEPGVDLASLNAEIRPQAILSFGVTASSLTRAPVMETEALEEILAKPDLKKKVWADLQQVMAWLGLRR
jgi:hypothetical protein